MTEAEAEREIEKARKEGATHFPMEIALYERMKRQRDTSRWFARSWKRAATERRKRETAE